LTATTECKTSGWSQDRRTSKERSWQYLERLCSMQWYWNRGGGFFGRRLW